MKKTRWNLARCFAAYLQNTSILKRGYRLDDTGSLAAGRPSHGVCFFALTVVFILAVYLFRKKQDGLLFG